MFEHFEFISLTQLGQLFGASSHQMGRWLVEVGLRTQYYEPSQQAIDGGFISIAKPEGGRPFVAWHREKTIQVLEQAGHVRIDCSSTEQVVGPFSAKATDDGKVVISDRSGFSCCVADDRVIAAKLVRLLNRETEIPRSMNQDFAARLFED